MGRRRTAGISAMVVSAAATVTALVLIVLTVVPALCLPRLPATISSELMTLDEARRYMVELINRDRASQGVAPVTLDPVASRAAQQHSDEMAQYGYVSHWDLQGRKPDQRYNEFGGRGAVFENVFTNHDQPYASYRAPLAARQLFSRRDIEQAEGWFFNQTPPRDRHRQNVLDPNHKLVGVGVSLSVHRTLGTRVTVSQEFVHSPGDLSAWSTDLIPGQVQKLTGKLSPAVSLTGLQLCREPLPKPLTTAQLKATGEYGLASETVTCYTPDAAGGPLETKKTPEGDEFSFSLNSQKCWPDGLYYLLVWVRDPANPSPYIGSTRTVRISATPAPPPITPQVLRESDVQVASVPAAGVRSGRIPAAPPPARPSGGGYYQGPRPAAAGYMPQSSLRFPVPDAIARYAAYAPLSTAPVIPARQYGLYAPPGSGAARLRSGQIVPQYAPAGPAPLMRNPNYVPPSAAGPSPERLGRSATFIESAPKANVPARPAAKPAYAIQPGKSQEAPPAAVLKTPPAAAPVKTPKRPAPAAFKGDPRQSLCEMEASE